MVIYHAALLITMFNKILVAVDGSDASLHALEVAAQIADDNNAELTILAVAPYPPATIIPNIMPTYLPRYQDDLRTSYEKILQETNQKLREKHPQLKTVPIFLEGNPARHIVEASQAREVDLIVIGNRGTGGIINWMLGSVSQQVVNSCTVPVLVVKHQDYCQV